MTDNYLGQSFKAVNYSALFTFNRHLLRLVWLSITRSSPDGWHEWVTANTYIAYVQFSFLRNNAKSHLLITTLYASRSSTLVLRKSENRQMIQSLPLCGCSDEATLAIKTFSAINSCKWLTLDSAFTVIHWPVQYFLLFAQEPSK